ncbi:putative two-component system response regulator [Chitinispirillum alkaliphilum]|nr:putative two-component system response regulator [Chitinispirillum alkaliphilum]
MNNETRQQPIRVAIVDDSPQWVRIITRELIKDAQFIVSWGVESVDDAIELAKKSNPDVILIDINIHNDPLGGIKLAKKLASFSTSKLIILSSMTDQQSLSGALSCSIQYFVPKDDLASLRSKVKLSLSKGDPILKAARLEIKKQRRDAALSKLSPAEREIFHLLETGCKRKHISEILFKSEDTVKSHIKGILRKLDCHDTAEAVEKMKT